MRRRLVEDERVDALTVAYAMSRWDTPIVNKIADGSHNQTEAFKYLSGKLGVSVNTLRNYRDTFDSHAKQENSNRQGWKKDLNDEQQMVKNQYDSESESEMVDVIKDILGIG